MLHEIIVSPRGEAEWAKVLGEPYAFEDNPRAWSIALLLDPSDPETIAFTEQLEKCFEEFHGAKAKVNRNGWPFSDHTTKDEKGREVPTGKIEFRFKRKELTSKGNEKSPPMVMDAKKNPWPKDRLIGNGSTVKIAFRPWPWEMQGGKGMSLELEGVQVIKLVEYIREVDPFEEEDGFVVEAPAAQSAFGMENELSPSQKLKQKASAIADEEDIPF